jgi:phytoene synthase
MLDDLLDLCPATDTGKAPLSDFPQQHWTWPLGILGIADFSRDVNSLLIAMHDSRNDISEGERCLSRYEEVIDSVIADAHNLLGKGSVLESLLMQWRAVAGDAVAREKARWLASHIAPGHDLTRRASVLSNEVSYLASNSKSFRFASRFFPRPMEARIARVYAWCRFTDDIVDDPAVAPDKASAMLDEWMALSRSAYRGEQSGIPMLDRVMLEMSDARVPFRYAEELADGMRMDLEGMRYDSMPQLRKYTYRVASVVGFWVSELFDVRDPAALSRAESMGHAMQLTNILRDVGEDSRNGRCYLPTDLMERHSVRENDLRAGRTSPGYRNLVKEMMEHAEHAFADGFDGLKDLPMQLRLPVSVAARAYRGILHEIRRNDYDNLTRRAGTSSARKAALMGRALIDVGAAGFARTQRASGKRNQLSFIRAHR